jgi:hypothetical protein
MSVNVKNTSNKIPTSAIGSLPPLTKSELIVIQELMDIPFYPEFPQTAEQMMINYAAGEGSESREKNFLIFCDYLIENNKTQCKLQWCGIFTYSQFNQNIDVYFTSLKTLERWIDYIQLNIPTIKKIILFLDEPALITYQQNTLSPTDLKSYSDIVERLSHSTQIYIHCCHHLPEIIPAIYRKFGLSFDADLIGYDYDRLGDFPYLAWGTNKQKLIPSELKHKIRLVTPSCGLAFCKHEQAIEILKKIQDL